MIGGAAATLKIGQFFALVGIVVVGMLLAGGVVIAGRKWLGGSASAGDGSNGSANEPPGSLVRSWIAVTLVMGLLVFAAASLWVPDPTIRSAMFGGLIASVGTAVAFYFSSQSADKTRSDILQTTLALSQGQFTPTTFTGSPPPTPAKKGQPYPAYKFTANGQPTPTFSVVNGSLPTGLTLNPDGGLTGTPTADPADFSFTVRATNVAGHIDQDFTITVN